MVLQFYPGLSSPSIPHSRIASRSHGDFQWSTSHDTVLLLGPTVASNGKKNIAATEMDFQCAVSLAFSAKAELKPLQPETPETSLAAGFALDTALPRAQRNAFAAGLSWASGFCYSRLVDAAVQPWSRCNCVVGACNSGS